MRSVRTPGLQVEFRPCTEGELKLDGQFTRRMATVSPTAKDEHGGDDGSNAAARRDGRVVVGHGRHFSYRDFGQPNGFPVIALHGTPGSGLKFKAAHAAAQDRGLRVIAPDRWGYGGTTMHPAPSLAEFAIDLATFADQLGLDRFAVLGISGGGPYAVAAASVLPSRIVALGLAAPVGPVAGEPDREISAFHRLCFGMLARHQPVTRAIFQSFRLALALSPDLGVRLAMLRAGVADRRLLKSPDVVAGLGDAFLEGLRPGVEGAVTDLALFGAPWRIDTRRARMPAKLWLGSSDGNIPRSAARRLALRLPCCELAELPGEGHLWAARNYDQVLAWIRAVVRPRA